MHELDRSTCVIRATGSLKGRTTWMAPDTAPLRYLHFGRIILDPGERPVSFANPGQETGLVNLKGDASVTLSDGSSFELGRYDSLYVPNGLSVEVGSRHHGCDLAEISAPVEGDYPVQFVRFADVSGNPGLQFQPAGAPAARTISILLGKNIQAGRILVGTVHSQPGNWTSWPPHEHAEMLEEAYLYIDMPSPSWGLQFVYTDAKNPEVVVPVRQDDAVVMPKGYHPNVAAPGSCMNFLWMMAALRETEDRKYGVVNVQPEYAGRPTGLEVGT
jgi:5-deoxy-glucuronate isomerase